ncbi:hypothetical protein [Halovulum marinum]|nr:hypothetical protein [Halovulum marinum]
MMLDRPCLPALAAATILALPAVGGEMAHYGAQPRAVEAQIVTAPVVTFPGFEDSQRQIDGATATLVSYDGGVLVDVATAELMPGHGYTMWFVPINAPEACAAAPCTSSDVVGNHEAVQSDVSYGAGAIADADGRARFTTHRAAGDLVDPWFGHGLQKPMTAEVHVVIRDHGPMDGLSAAAVEDALTSHAGQCDPGKLPDFDGARIGMAGGYACQNVQDAVFIQGAAPAL